MAHVREQVRKAIVAALLDQTSAGTRVYSTRIHPVKIDALPYISVVVDADTGTLESSNNQATRRDLAVQVVCYAKANADLDDALDDLGAAVEATIAADETLGGIARQCVFESASFDFEGEADQPIGTLTNNFLAQTRIWAAIPDTVNL